MIDKVTEGEHGGDHTSETFKQSKTDIISLDNIGYGNSRQYSLRKLRNSNPALHEKVLSGELSPHAAMIEAGFRKKTITIPIEVAKVIQVIKKHFTGSLWKDTRQRGISCSSEISRAWRDWEREE